MSRRMARCTTWRCATARWRMPFAAPCALSMRGWSSTAWQGRGWGARRARRGGRGARGGVGWVVGWGVGGGVHGVDVPVRPDTLCIHGDQPGAAQFAQAIRAALEAEGIAIAPITRPNPTPHTGPLRLPPAPTTPPNGSPDSGPIAEPHRRATATP